MKQRITTALIYILAMAGLVLPTIAYPCFIVVLLTLIAFLASKEMTQAFQNRQLELSLTGMRLYSFAFVLVLASQALIPCTGKAVTWQKMVLLNFALYFLWIVLVSVVLFLGQLREPGPDNLPLAIVQTWAGLYLSWPLFLACQMVVCLPQGPYFLILTLVSPWICDSFALFFGMACGKRKLSPHISPNKTVAGFLGGLLGVVLLYLLVFLKAGNLFFGFKLDLVLLAFWLLIAVVVAVFDQLGDLLASAIKRYCGIKDFSQLLPGHGGVIDRFDSSFIVLNVIFPILVLLFGLA